MSALPEFFQYFYLLAAILGVLLLSFLLPALLLFGRLVWVARKIGAMKEWSDNELNAIFKNTGVLDRLWGEHSNRRQNIFVMPLARDTFRLEAVLSALNAGLFRKLPALFAVIGVLGIVYGLLVGQGMIEAPGGGSGKPLHGAWDVLLASALSFAFAAFFFLVEWLVLAWIKAGIEKVARGLDALPMPQLKEIISIFPDLVLEPAPTSSDLPPSESPPAACMPTVVASAAVAGAAESEAALAPESRPAQPSGASQTQLKHKLGKLHSLPAMPAIAQKLLALPLHTEAGEAQLVGLIEQDPQISAKLIGLANSPVHGLRRKVSAVSDVAFLFGIPKIKSVAIGIATFSNLSKLPPCEYFKPQDLWLHSMTAAIVMHAISRAMPVNMRPEEDQIFLAGLLHDMGYVVLHYVDPATSNELHYQLRVQAERPVLEIERELLGMTHCDIGARLAEHWHLPPEIVAVMAHHHAPYAAEVSVGHHLVRLAALAEKILPGFDSAGRSGNEIEAEEWLGLGIAFDETERILNQVDELAAQTAQLGELL